MKVKVIILLLLLTGSLTGSAQFFSERSAEHNLARGKWDRAYAQLVKLKSKDSTNAVADYLLARYYSDPTNRAWQVDSANQFLKKATLNFQIAVQKLRDRWKRFPLDSTMLQHTRNIIDSIAFSRAAEQNTVDGYTFFLREYPHAAQQSLATELLHEVAYINALRVNTYQAFYTYLEQYPTAIRFEEARKRYEKLLYEDKTVDKRLKSYQRFLSEYPDSPHRAEAEWKILERMTAIGTISSFKQFIQAYPGSSIIPQVKNILFYLLPEEERMEWAQHHLMDSLVQLLESKPQYLVPVLHQDESVFLDDDGKFRFSVHTKRISEGYWCGNIQEDVVVLSDRLVNVTGQTIIHQTVEALDDLGHGFLLLQSGECKRVIHKSGFAVGDSCVQDARVICNQFLVLKKYEKWSIWTFTGLQLQPYKWDDIFNHDQVIVLKQNNKVKLVTASTMATVADQQALKLHDAYDSLQRWKQGLIWVKASDFQGVLDQQLSIYIPFEKHTLTQTAHGISSLFDSRVTVYRTGKAMGTYARMIEQVNWIALKTVAWQLMHVEDSVPMPRLYDSIYFAGPFAIGQWSDSLQVWGADRTTIKFKSNAVVEFISGQDSAYFLLVDHNEKKILYDQHLKKVMPVVYDKIQYAGEGLFMVHKKEHKGLITAEGKLILPIEYDAIGTVRDGLVSVLNAMKFGYFDVKQKRLIKSAYYKNPWTYTPGLVVAFSQPGYGFVDWNNKPKSDFVFEEILYWNDTTALVKKDKQFMLYEIKTRKVLLDGIKNYHLIRSDPQDQLMIIEQENGYGVIHNKKGIVIPISYSDIVNLGTKEKPFYFTEKHVEEAALFVVIYYNHEGQMIRKEVYEADDYELIYCAD